MTIIITSMKGWNSHLPKTTDEFDLLLSCTLFPVTTIRFTWLTIICADNYVQVFLEYKNIVLSKMESIVEIRRWPRYTPPPEVALTIGTGCVTSSLCKSYFHYKLWGGISLFKVEFRFSIHPVKNINLHINIAALVSWNIHYYAAKDKSSNPWHRKADKAFLCHDR